MSDPQENEKTLLETHGGTPQEVSPEAEQPKTETPAVPDSAAAAGESAPPSKTPEQLAADAAHWQTQFQEEHEKTKHLKGLTDEALAKLRDLAPKPMEEQPSPRPAAPSPRPPDLDDNAMNEALRENPMLGFQAVSEHLRTSVASEVAKIFDERERQREYRYEEREANRTLNEFAQKANISSDEVQAARQELVNLGIKGSPAGIAALTIQQLNARVATKNIAERVAKAEADAAQKVKTGALTRQPGTTTPGVATETPELSPAEVIARKFTRPAPKTAEQALLAGRKVG